jgi:hypothetical protein
MAILVTVESMAVGTKLAHLVREIKPLVPDNEYQRRAVVSILGCTGILRIPGRSGFSRSLTQISDREETPWHKDDWPYPVGWWRGGSGVDQAAVDFWLGEK